MVLLLATMMVDLLRGSAAMRAATTRAVSDAPYDADDFSEHAEFLAVGTNDDRLQRGVLGLQNDIRSVAGKALYGGIAVDQRSHDVSRIGRLLSANDDEVAFDDVRVHHAVALDAQREYLAALDA